MNAQSDELSLRDIYLLLSRWRWSILGLAVGAAILTLAVSLLVPRTYVSKVVVSLSLSNQSNQGLLNNLPSLPGLAQGFVDLQNTTLLSKELDVDDPTELYTARFDDRRGLLNLSADGRSPAEASQRADRILTVAKTYLQARMAEGVQANTRAALAQARLDLQASSESLKRIQQQLRSSPDFGGVTDPTVAAALEARQTDPQAARTSSPAFTSLSLDESRLRSQIAQLEARVDTFTKFLSQPESISQLVGQALMVQVLVPPAEPLRASFPRPFLFTAIAAVLGLLLGVLWAFIAESIRARGGKEASPASRSDLAEASNLK